MATKKTAAKKTATRKKRPMKKYKAKAMVGQEPIIITGGSMNVTFDPPFTDDASGGEGYSRVSEATNPISTMKITGLEVQDIKGNLLMCYKLPEDLQGECYIIIMGE
ncbi:MAG: hypothetical protein QOF02_773 [Blastocatellia bacterium]|jgi:hypothetical protein|nr:hypothetical protein [Blastocatellia bacterium]